MIFSVTEIGTFLRCRRQWWETSFNGNALTLPMPAPALNTGSVWHKSQEIEAEAAPGLDMAVDVAFDGQLDIINESLREVRGFELEQHELNDLREQADLLKDMAMNYEAYWRAAGEYPIPPNFDIVQAEQTVVVPIPNTPHSLEGTLDALMVNRNDGLVWVLERKTFERHPDPEMMDMEFQFTAYQWMVRQLGYEPGGVAYDGAWKRHSPPNKRTMDDLFLRRPLTRTEAWLNDFERSLTQQALDMAEACLIPARRYPNKTTFVAGCKYCSVRPVCDAMSNDQDADAIRRMLYTHRDPGNRAAIWAQQETD
jgi:hypothetical protein